MAFGDRMVLCFENYAARSTTTFSDSGSDLDTTIANNAISNLGDPVLGRRAVFQSATTAQFDIDLGSALPVQVLALLDTNLPGLQGVSPATVTITGSSDSGHSSQVYTATAHNSQSVDSAVNGVSVRNLFRVDLGQEYTARYWRILLTVPTTAVAFYVGHVYIGPGYQPRAAGDTTSDEGFVPFGVRELVLDESARERTGGDTDLGDVRRPRRGFEFTLRHIGSTKWPTIYRKLKWACGSRRDWLFILDPTETDKESIQFGTVWGNDNGVEPLELVLPGRRDTTIQIVERL